MASLALFERIEATLADQLALIAEDEKARKVAGIGARFQDESYYDPQAEAWIQRGGFANATDRKPHYRTLKGPDGKPLRDEKGQLRRVLVKPKPLSRFDQERIAAGFTQKDISNVRAALRADTGATLTPEETLAAIVQWRAQNEGAIQGHRGKGAPEDVRKAKAAEKMRRWREKRHAEGGCRTCGRTCAPGRDYCDLCVSSGSERSKKSQQRRAKQLAK